MLGPVGLLDLIGSGVAAGQEPLLAAVAVIPPLDLRSGDVLAEEQVAGQLPFRASGSYALVRLAAEAELADLSMAAVRTAHEKGHQSRALPFGCLRARSSNALPT